jgi:hypothetical protein
MATPYKAEDFVLKVDARTFGCLGSFEFSSNTAENETTCTASGNVREFTPGMNDATLSGSGIIRKLSNAEAATEIGDYELLQMKDAGETLSFVFGSKTIGDDVISGTFFLTNVTYTKGDVGSPPTFSFSGRVVTYAIATVAA